MVETFVTRAWRGSIGKSLTALMVAITCFFHFLIVSIWRFVSQKLGNQEVQMTLISLKSPCVAICVSRSGLVSPSQSIRNWNARNHWCFTLASFREHNIRGRATEQTFQLQRTDVQQYDIYDTSINFYADGKLVLNFNYKFQISNSDEEGNDSLQPYGIFNSSFQTEDANILNPITR